MREIPLCSSSLQKATTGLPGSKKKEKKAHKAGLLRLALKGPALTCGTVPKAAFPFSSNLGTVSYGPWPTTTTILAPPRITITITITSTSTRSALPSRWTTSTLPANLYIITPISETAIVAEPALVTRGVLCSRLRTCDDAVSHAQWHRHSPNGRLMRRSRWGW